MKFSRKVTQAFLFLLLKAITFVSRALPWHIGVYFGGLLGGVTYHILRRERKRSIEGLQVAFGETKSMSELETISKRNFKNLGKGLIEILNLHRLTPERVQSLISIEGEEYLQEAVNRGEGTILVTGHIGNWELLAAGLCIRGHRIHAIAAPILDHRIDEWIVQLRSRLKVETISRGAPSSSRKILSVLRRQEILGLLIDQDAKVDGVFVNFFNKKAYTPAGAAQLALRKGVTTMMCFVTRLPGDRHHITIQKPIHLIRTGDGEKDIEMNTALFTSRIEEQIKQYPDQWVWMHRRWKTKPPKK
ncbi:MAG: lysophospholipid acyltransferase family protein [Nitrospiria bacterium]